MYEVVFLVSYLRQVVWNFTMNYRYRLNVQKTCIFEKTLSVQNMANASVSASVGDIIPAELRNEMKQESMLIGNSVQSVRKSKNAISFN